MDYFINKLQVLRNEIRIPLNNTVIEFNQDNSNNESIVVTPKVSVESCELFEVDSLKVFGDVHGYENTEMIQTSGKFRTEPLFLTCEVRLKYRLKRENKEKSRMLKLFGHTNQPLIINYNMTMIESTQNMFFTYFDTEYWPSFKYIMKRTGKDGTFKDIARRVLQKIPYQLMQTIGQWLLDWIQDQFDENTEYPTQQNCPCLSDRHLRKDSHIKPPEEKSDEEMNLMRKKPKDIVVIDLNVIKTTPFSTTIEFVKQPATSTSVVNLKTSQEMTTTSSQTEQSPTTKTTGWIVEKIPIQRKMIKRKKVTRKRNKKTGRIVGLPIVEEVEWLTS